MTFNPDNVWLRIPEDEEMAEAEANIYRYSQGGYRVDWYLTSVGLVTSVYFASLQMASAWLLVEEFEDYTS